MPDRTFNFAVASFAMCLIALGYLMLWPVIQIEEMVGEAITYRNATILTSGNTWAIVIATFPTLIVGGSILTMPRSGRLQRSHKINVTVGTLVLWVYVVMFSGQVGIVYIPAATMLTSVVVLVFVRSRAWGKGDFGSDAEAAEAETSEAVRAPRRRRRRSARTTAVGRRPRRRNR